MTANIEPFVTTSQELIVPTEADTIGSMEQNPELVAFSLRMHEICDDMKLPRHGRQSALAGLFKVSQKGARKWLEAESFPRWEHIIRITEWAGITVEWLMSGRGPKTIDLLYPTRAIAHVAGIMSAMEPDQQYLVARLADQIKKPSDPAIPGKDDPLPAAGTGQ